MEHTIGEGDVFLSINVAGVYHRVIPAKEAAILAGYSRTHMCRLCDEGKILSHKIAGVWWVQSWQLRLMEKDS